jgi:hypothetical protein
MMEEISIFVRKPVSLSLPKLYTMSHAKLLQHLRLKLLQHHKQLWDANIQQETFFSIRTIWLPL